MKQRLFTLFTLVLCAVVSVVAQGKYAIAVGDAPTAGSQITSVDNITLTYGATGDENNFAAAKANKSVTGYTAFTAGNGNNVTLTDGRPTAGTFYGGFF